MRAARMILPVVAGAMLYVGSAQAELATEQVRAPNPARPRWRRWATLSLHRSASP